MKIEELSSFLSHWRHLNLEPAQVRDHGPTQPTGCRGQGGTGCWAQRGTCPSALHQHLRKRWAESHSIQMQKGLQPEHFWIKPEMRPAWCLQGCSHTYSKTKKGVKFKVRTQKYSISVRSFQTWSLKTTEYQYSGCLCNHYLFAFRYSPKLKHYIVLFHMEEWGHALHSSSTLFPLHSPLIMEYFRSDSCPNILKMQKLVHYSWEEQGLQQVKFRNCEKCLTLLIMEKP